MEEALIIGGVAGFFIGYAIRKIIKILAITLGVFFLAMISLDYMGAFAIDYERFVEFISKLFDPAQAVIVLMPLIVNLPFLSSFVAGCLIGLTRRH